MFQILKKQRGIKRKYHTNISVRIFELQNVHFAVTIKSFIMNRCICIYTRIYVCVFIFIYLLRCIYLFVWV